MRASEIDRDPSLFEGNIAAAERSGKCERGPVLSGSQSEWDQTERLAQAEARGVDEPHSRTAHLFTRSRSSKRPMRRRGWYCCYPTMR